MVYIRQIDQITPVALEKSVNELVFKSLQRLANNEFFPGAEIENDLFVLGFNIFDIVTVYFLITEVCL